MPHVGHPSLRPQAPWWVLNQAGVLLGRISVGVVAVIAAMCVLTLPWSLQAYDQQRVAEDLALVAPGGTFWWGSDELGRSLLWRSLLGGAISLGVGLASAAIAVFIGVAWGMVSGYVGGRVDALMMRIVDVLYGLPYVLLVVLAQLAIQPGLTRMLEMVSSESNARTLASMVSLLVAIGGVSWLTMARVIRGQVLSLRAQPFVEAARAVGVPGYRIMGVHLLPNLVGPIVVYATLTVPTAILQESFLSFLGIGIRPPLPSWGNLASEGIVHLHALARPGTPLRWWLIFFPCALLGVTLMALNFLGESLREKLDPKGQKR